MLAQPNKAYEENKQKALNKISKAYFMRKASPLLLATISAQTRSLKKKGIIMKHFVKLKKIQIYFFKIIFKKSCCKQ